MEQLRCDLQALFAWGNIVSDWIGQDICDVKWRMFISGKPIFLSIGGVGVNLSVEHGDTETLVVYRDFDSYESPFDPLQDKSTLRAEMVLKLAETGNYSAWYLAVSEILSETSELEECINKRIVLKFKPEVAGGHYPMGNLERALFISSRIMLKFSGKMVREAEREYNIWATKQQ